MVGVKHNSDHVSNSSGRKVLGECGSHLSVVSVGHDDLAPNASESGITFCCLCLVDISNSLAHIEACV